MKTVKTILFLLFQSLILVSQAQVRISGHVFTPKGEPLGGVNVFIQGSYDGSTTDSLGLFNFKTEEPGNQTLVASYVGFETQAMELNLESDISDLKIIMKEAASELDEVVINAGAFEASDKKKSVILKPLDVALTAGANGDIFGAFGTLPGSHRVGEEGRLFVRGGESYETKTFMDGMLINSPYFSKMPDLPTRGRYSPLLFNGAVFSTGGYSAEYGQALSSIVALNTVALEAEDKSSISVMSVGFQGSHSERWENSSLALTGEYLHTGLSNKLFQQNIQWLREPVITGSTFMFRHKTSETGMIKSFGSFSYNSSSMLYNNFGESSFENVDLKNNNIYFNTTYNEQLSTDWMLNSGIAFNTDGENTLLGENQISTKRKSSQVKTTFTNTTFKKVTTKLGSDFIYYDYAQEINMNGEFKLPFSNRQFSVFAESEAKITPDLALRAGVRAERSSLIQKTNVMPRLSAAVKTGKSSQLSAAYGNFVQNPEDDYLKFTTALAPEKSTHSILTWQYKKGTKTLRIEAYNKNYSDLVKFEEEFSMEPGNYNNLGSGYSRGLDIFWRNQQEFGKSDYWISYSWNDSKRNYRDYQIQATPHYVSKHNLSIVYKKFFPKISSFISTTYSFASGRPYFNPNNPVFMSDHTKPYNDFSMGFTHIMYLFNTQSVVHLIVNNVFGFNNIYGYHFNELPNNQGVYEAEAITPPSKRMAVILISFQL